jgi:O-antigen/teichoic acid export membrane protein
VIKGRRCPPRPLRDGPSVRRSSPEEGSLARLASRALGWSFASNTAARFGVLPIGIVLARILGPHAFGTYAVALVALMAVLSFNDLSVGLAIVRWEGDPTEIAPTVATISLASSLVTYAGCYLAAPAFASAMGAPAATGVVRVLALNVIVDGITTCPAAFMERHFCQERKAIADQVNCWLGAAVSIALALAGYGAMSLAIGRMVGAFASAVLFLVLSPVPMRFGFDAAKVRGLCRFGLPLAGASAVGFAVMNVDQLVVGHMLGTTALGYYALALNLAGWPVTMFSLPVRNVAPAVFSQLQQDRPAMRAGFLSVAGVLGSVALPVCLVMGGTAVPLLGFVYGTVWIPAARALVWLAVVGALRILDELIYDFFVVLARARALLTVQVAWLGALMPALIAGTWADGISGAGMAEVAVAGCVVLPWYLGALNRVGIRPRDLAGRLFLPLVAAAGAGAAAAATVRVIHVELAAIAAGGGFGLFTIGLLVWWAWPSLAALRDDLRQRPAVCRAGTSAGAGRQTAPQTAMPGSSPRPTVAAPQSAALVGLPAPRLESELSLPWDALVSLPSFHDFTGPLPVYLATVASLSWDPAYGRRGRHAADSTLHREQRHARDPRWIQPAEGS